MQKPRMPHGVTCTSSVCWRRLRLPDRLHISFERDEQQVLGRRKRSEVADVSGLLLAAAVGWRSDHASPSPSPDTTSQDGRHAVRMPARARPAGELLAVQRHARARVPRATARAIWSPGGAAASAWEKAWVSGVRTTGTCTFAAPRAAGLAVPQSRRPCPWSQTVADCLFCSVPTVLGAGRLFGSPRRVISSLHATADVP